MLIFDLLKLASSSIRDYAIADFSYFDPITLLGFSDMVELDATSVTFLSGVSNPSTKYDPRHLFAKPYLGSQKSFVFVWRESVKLYLFLKCLGELLEGHYETAKWVGSLTRDICLYV